MTWDPNVGCIGLATDVEEFDSNFGDGKETRDRFCRLCSAVGAGLMSDRNQDVIELDTARFARNEASDLSGNEERHGF